MHVLGELESALSEQTPPTQQENPSLHELPHLVMDGIPTPVDKMTQVCLITLREECQICFFRDLNNTSMAMIWHLLF